MSDETKVTKQQAIDNIVNMLHDVAVQAADGQDHGTMIQILRTLQQKPGVKTTEFWLAALLNVVGIVVLCFPGKEAFGTTIMLVSSSLYTVSRVVVKNIQANDAEIVVPKAPAA